MRKWKGRDTQRNHRIHFLQQYRDMNFFKEPTVFQKGNSIYQKGVKIIVASDFSFVARQRQ